MSAYVLKRALLGWLLCASVVAAPAKPAPWIITWSAPADSAGPALKAQTLRQVFRTSVGGGALRIRLSNLFGTQPVTIGPVHLAQQTEGAGVDPASDHVITFHGQATVTIAKGQSIWSDAVRLPVAPLQRWAVSLYLPTDTGPTTIHGTAVQNGYLTKTGDATAATTLTEASNDDSRYFLTDVALTAAGKPRTMVLLGDSITDGIGSTYDHYTRWPDQLAQRLHDDPLLASIAVLNAGISGNRILNDGVDPFVGPSALARFERDVVSKPGVRWMVLLEGINDINGSVILPTARDQVSAQQIIQGMQTLVSRAHKRGIKVFGATLLPFAGTKGVLHHTPEAEAKRQAVNAWIRTGKGFDAVIDFDQVLRDPAKPDQLLAAFDSGDHLHPNDAGYAAMAAAVDLKWLADK